MSVETRNGAGSPGAEEENGGQGGLRGVGNLEQRDYDYESANGDMVAVPRSLLNKILRNTEENKNKAREADIRARVSQIKNAAPKRAVSHLMKTLHLIEDAEEAWDDLTETADRNEIHIIREDNAEKANEALRKQGMLLEKVKKHIKEEIGNQTIGATSVYGFKVVGFKERDPTYEKDLLGVDEDDVRALEKAFVQRERKFDEMDELVSCNQNSYENAERQSWNSADTLGGWKS